MREKLGSRLGFILLSAGCANIKKGVYETTEYLELFLRNLLLNENNPLKNRDMHISGSLSSPKCNEQSKNCTLDCTLDEITVLNLLKSDGKLTQKKIAELIGKSERTVKTITTSLEKKGFITRINGKRFGYWNVNIQ